MQQSCAGKKGKFEKTTVVGSKYSHKLILQAKHKKFGVSAKVGTAAKDFGLGRTGGLRRTMIGIKDRVGKARVEANRVGYLARRNRRAKALYGTGVLPAATYGAEAVGYSPSMTNNCEQWQLFVWAVPHVDDVP